MYVRILSYLKPHTGRLLWALLLSLLFATSNVLFMPLTRDIVNGIAVKEVAYIHNHMINAFLLYALRLAAKAGLTYVMAYVGLSVINTIRIQLFSNLQSLSIDFHHKWKQGDIITRAFMDVEKVKQAIILNFEEVLPNILTLLGVIGYLFYISWKLTLFAGLSIPLFIFLVSFFTKMIKKVTGQIQRKTSNLTHLFQESLSNIKIIQAFTMEKHQINKFIKATNRNFLATLKETKLKCLQNPSVSYLQFASFAAVVWYGAFEVANGNMTGPNLASFFTGTLLLIDPVIALSNIFTTTQQSLVSAHRIFEILDSEPTIQSPTHPTLLPKIHGKLEFKNVGFQYSERGEQVLEGFDLSVSAGEIVALVGPSGAGKSTIINLIPRFYDPTSGDIKLDGVDLRAIDLKALRSHIAIVPQESILFRGTILENIRYGKTSATEPEVIDALKQANAWEFVSELPDQIFAKVGDKGFKLSGGQRQRISIARAILRDPRILILDEATSALDSTSEKLVQDALVKLMKNRTTFVIAHRLSTIIHANKIVVIVNGRIDDVGTHEMLIQKAGMYSTLYTTQFESGQAVLQG